MKKYIAAVMIILGMAAFFHVQGTDNPSNSKKSQEEIEIMKGILNTTLSYAARNLNQQAGSTASSKINTQLELIPMQFPKINAFRLMGQGVVFEIPITSMRIFNSGVFAGNYGAELSARLEGVAASSTYVSAEAALAQDALAQESLWTNNKSSAGQDPSAQKREETLKKKAEELQAKIQKRREEDQAKKEKFLRDMAEIKSRMIETLANYGDSFTTIKPDEYINLVLTPGSRFVFETDHSLYQAISIKRSRITDYKAGKLTLDTFKQKVLSYSE